MKEIYFMRHAKTQENTEHVVIGQNDPPLSEEGRKEIQFIKSIVVQPDVVFSSDLRRASETARLLFPNHEITLLPHLRERHFGELQGKPKNALTKAGMSREAMYRLGGEEAILRVYGAEPLSSLEARAEQVLGLIKKADVERIVVVSHGTFINCLMLHLLSEPNIVQSLGNLNYHQITLDSRGNVIAAKLNQEWSCH